MRVRHLAGAVAAATLVAIAGPAATAQAETGIFRYSLPGGNEGSIEDPMTYQCYELESPDKPVSLGFNNTVFVAELYADGGCQHPVGTEVRPNSGFRSDPSLGVQFRPAGTAAEPAATPQASTTTLL
ncbi:hypothetical protein [Streptomyces radicis]|uniref:Uncharacterized protein n=1 Tax=Streptomyces radicis TaxID=1750517 RepID=A0A3A9VZA3_9ACTN|nr:hypothetical protein [Streptomyces radicis]RKN06261.1 hypothetical protein D7319_22430 [Streptomyces radicis]RKN18591.1 hypothetical protein D7318_21290 [Streptomyces radicis]